VNQQTGRQKTIIFPVLINLYQFHSIIIEKVYYTRTYIYYITSLFQTQ